VVTVPRRATERPSPWRNGRRAPPGAAWRRPSRHGARKGTSPSAAITCRAGESGRSR
jgi:hypothetical protein